MKDRGSEKTKIAGRAWNVERAGKRQGFAGIDRFSTGKFLEIALNQIGDAQENFRSLCRRPSRPFGKSLFCRSDG